MRKNIYLLTAAVMTGIMVTACAPKNAGTQTDTSIESSAEAESSEAESSEAEPPESADAPAATEKGDGAGETAESQETDGALASDETLDRIHEAVKKAYGDAYIPSMPYDAAALSEVFGVSEDLYDAAVAEGPMISVHVDTFIGIKAKEGKGKEVAKALSDYRDSQIESAMQYPMNMVKTEASQVVEKGDYVFFVMLGSADEDAEAEGEEAALESAKKNNQKAVDEIDKVLS